ncbi:MAG: prolyl oligopeptidase family serine peptidase, partial [Edaphobacter sp.]
MRKVFFVTAAVLLGSVAAGAQIHGRDGITLPNSPAVKTQPVVDEYKSSVPGVPTKITDQYRWLEDAHSPETRAYIAAQNAYTAKYFAQVKMLPSVVEAMGKLLKTDFVGVPTQRGDRYFFSKLDADQNQAS